MQSTKRPARFPQILVISHFAIIILLCFGGLKISAQNQHFPTVLYTVEDGLSNSTVLGIAKDTCGFLWITTSNGINRFDGSRFKQYQTGLPHFSAFPGIGYQGELWMAFPSVTTLKYE